MIDGIAEVEWWLRSDGVGELGVPMLALSRAQPLLPLAPLLLKEILLRLLTFDSCLRCLRLALPLRVVRPLGLAAGRLSNSSMWLARRRQYEQPIGAIPRHA